MTRRTRKAAPLPLDSRPAEEIAAVVKAATARDPRVGDVIPNPDPSCGGEVLIVAVTADGRQAVPMWIVSLVIGALRLREIR